MASDSEDELPLAQRQLQAGLQAREAALTSAPAAPSAVAVKPEQAGPAPAAAPQQNGAHAAPAAKPAPRPAGGRLVIDSSDDDSDVPLASRKPAAAQQPKKPGPAAAAAAAAKPAAAAAPKRPSPALDDAVMLPTAPKPKPKPPAVKQEVKEEWGSDSDSDVPLAKRRQSLSGTGAAGPSWDTQRAVWCGGACAEPVVRRGHVLYGAGALCSAPRHAPVCLLLALLPPILI